MTARIGVTVTFGGREAATYPMSRLANASFCTVVSGSIAGVLLPHSADRINYNLSLPYAQL
jgi:hypothetical protein